MTVIPRREQLALFGEQAEVPNWSDLSDPMRRDAIRLLAQLLVNAQLSHLDQALHEQGGRDE